MSLIYDALRQQADPARPAQALPRVSWWSRHSLRRRGGVLLAAGALLAVPLAFLTAGGPGQPASAPLAEAAGLHAVETTPAATPAMAAAPDADSRSGQVSSASVEVAQVPVAAIPATGEVAVAVAEPQPQPQPINIKVEQRTVESGQDTRHDDRAIAQVVSEIEAAIAAGDVPGARNALARLEAILPVESLTLLRMRAWVAHGSQDMDSAEQLYRQIIERLPDDVNAGVNVALLDAGRGDIDDARHRLMHLAGRYARSPLVARALAELDALPQ